MAVGYRTRSVDTWGLQDSINPIASGLASPPGTPPPGTVWPGTVPPPELRSTSRNLITIDSSAMMSVLLYEASRPAMLELTRGMALQSAASMPWELVNALMGLVNRRRITITDALQAITALDSIPIRLVDISLSMSLHMASRHRINPRDIYDVACAVKCRTPLLSLDSRRCAAGRRAGVRILYPQP